MRKEKKKIIETDFKMSYSHPVQDAFQDPSRTRPRTLIRLYIHNQKIKF